MSKCRHDFRKNLVTGYWQCVKCDEPGHPITERGAENLRVRTSVVRYRRQYGYERGA